MDCLPSFRTKNWLEFHENVSGNEGFSGVVMPSEGTKLLEFNQYWKNDKTPSTIYTDLESWIKKVDSCKNDPEYITKVHEEIPSAYLMSTIWRFAIENKQDL